MRCQQKISIEGTASIRRLRNYELNGRILETLTRNFLETSNKSTSAAIREKSQIAQ